MQITKTTHYVLLIIYSRTPSSSSSLSSVIVFLYSKHISETQYGNWVCSSIVYFGWSGKVTEFIIFCEEMRVTTRIMNHHLDNFSLKLFFLHFFFVSPFLSFAFVDWHRSINNCWLPPFHNCWLNHCWRRLWIRCADIHDVVVGQLFAGTLYRTGHMRMACIRNACAYALSN